MAENKTLCIACKYKFHDRDLQPCADCLRATQLVQRGVDRYQKAAEPKTGAPVPDAPGTSVGQNAVLCLQVYVLRLGR